MLHAPTDAHPLGHMIDHQHEAKRYDPEGNWVRRWLPVLARLPVQYIHRWVAGSQYLSTLLQYSHRSNTHRRGIDSGRLARSICSAACSHE